jgi:hypothetical protein
MPVTVTNTRSHVAKGLADGLIKTVKQEKFLGRNLFPYLVSVTNQNGMSAMSTLSYVAAQ